MRRHWYDRPGPLWLGADRGLRGLRGLRAGLPTIGTRVPGGWWAQAARRWSLGLAAATVVACLDVPHAAAVEARPPVKSLLEIRRETWIFTALSST
jgi:hypothetical protein